MKFKLEFDMDGTLFYPEDGSIEYAELRRILEEVAKEVEWKDFANVRDINGSTIGKWEII